MVSATHVTRRLARITLRVAAVLAVVASCALGCSGASGAGAERARSVSQEGSGQKDTPAGMPRIWVLAIGVSNYKDTSLALQYADRDAAAIDSFFASSGGGSLPPERRILLVNEEATRAAVLTALTTLSRRTAPEDMMILFLAMHGLPDPGGDLYYLTHDTDVKQLIGTGLPQRDIEYAVGRAQAKRVVMLADACHAGAAGFDGFRSRRGAGLAETNRLVGQLAESKPGTAVLTASTATESSVEGQRWGGGHGAFTHHLLQGLQGGADTNRDSFVSIRELFDFVYQNVSRDTEGAQHPELKGSFDNKMPLAELPAAFGGGLPGKGAPAPPPAEDNTPLTTRERKEKVDELANECQKDQWASCSVLGAMHAAGEGVSLQGGTALGLFQRACDGGDAPGCFGLATFHEGGRQLAKDLPRAAELYQKSCDGGHGPACAGLARMLATGQGVTADKPRAQSLLRKAVTLDDKRCREHDAAGCHELAEALLQGEGIAADPARARSLLGRACTAGLARSCDLGAQLAGHGSAQARELLERACAGDLARSCSRLSSVHYEPSGKQPDPSKAVGLLRQACSLKDAGACRTCSAIAEQAHEFSALAVCTQLACDLGDVSSCMTAASRYESGALPFGHNPVLAGMLYGRACVAGNRFACEKRDALLSRRPSAVPPR
jgi:TPR repeat protein